MSGEITQPHCPTCVCGRRAPVQASHDIPVGQPGRGPGTVSWEEHALAAGEWARQYGPGQDAERLAQRGGFSFYELSLYLGHPPKTWRPR